VGSCLVVFGRAWSSRRRVSWARVRSGQERDARVGVDERVGGGPVVEDPHDLSAGAAHDAGGGVPELPTQHFRFRDGERSVETAELEPADEVGRERDDREAGPVGVEINEREPFQPRVFQATDVVLDVRVGAHVRVKRDRITGLVRVVAPVTELERREQRRLRAGMQRLAPHDQPQHRTVRHRPG